MSYVLEALKKAEADKDPNAKTSLILEHRERARSRVLMWLVIAALLANLVVLLWLFSPWTHERSSTGTAQENSTSSGVSIASPPASLPATPDTSQTPVLPQVPDTPQAGTTLPGGALPPVSDQTVSAPPAATPKSAQRPARRRDLADLPASARARFPGLAFSTHVFADDPTLRTLVVNGTKMVEGDHYGVLELVEITEEGAVFAFEDYLVSIPVIAGWD